MNLDHAETVVLPEHLRPDRVDALADAAAEVQGRYQEYVRSLDEVPVLVDVVREPPRAPTKDFRLGQRRDERKAPRGDAAELRDQHGSEIEQQYAEYAVFDAGLAPTKGAEPRRTATNSGAQKKRAKRAKRSARSKS
jgi:hypothetical protein